MSDAKNESGWCIELGKVAEAPPVYWCGSGNWSTDNLAAVRFARKEDAEKVANAIPEDCMVAEHAWG